jgi:hypothetical protein
MGITYENETDSPMKGPERSTYGNIRNVKTITYENKNATDPPIKKPKR